MSREATIGRVRRTLLAAGAVICAVIGPQGLTGQGPLAEADAQAQTQPAEATETVSTTQPAARSFDDAVVLTIRGTISEITRDSLRRRLREVEERGASLVLLELDTPGGALGATLEICTIIKELRDSGTAVYAWVNKQAYSAGTIIALATDGIVMARNATIGDCQPIMMTGTGVSAIPEEIEAKATSPLLAELRDSSRRNRYSLSMIYALIRPEMQMFWLENIDTGERRFVDLFDRDRLFGREVEDRAQDKSEGSDKGTRRRLSPEPIPDSESQTAWRYVTAAAPLSEVTQPIVGDRDLLTMPTDEALAYGFSLATLNSDAELKQYFGVTGSMTRLQNTWLETVIEWLASPMVRSVLFLLMMLGAYTEFQTPGFGLPGVVALVALLLFLGAPYLAGTTRSWEIVAIVAGVILLALELFVIPGFGLAGIMGIILIIVGLLASYVPPEPSFDPASFRLPTMRLTYQFLERGLYSLAGGLTASIVGMFIIARYLPRTAFGSRIIAPNPQHDAVQIDDPYQGIARVGDVGVSESLLRPAGKARFGGRLVDVVSQGDYIETGERVRVVERSGNRVVVRQAD